MFVLWRESSFLFNDNVRQCPQSIKSLNKNKGLFTKAIYAFADSPLKSMKILLSRLRGHETDTQLH